MKRTLLGGPLPDNDVERTLPRDLKHVSVLTTVTDMDKLFTVRIRYPEVKAVSLTVSPELLDKARRGAVADDDFIDCIRTSLPYAYNTVARLAGERGKDVFAANEVPPPDEVARGQLLRAMSSNAIRAALERHFDVTLAFQNCHRVAVFAPHAESSDKYREFTSVSSQVLNQRPEFVNC